MAALAFREVAVVDAKGGWVDGACFDPSGDVVLLRMNGRAHLHALSASASAARASFEANVATSRFAWTPDGRHVAHASGVQRLEVFDAGTGAAARAPIVHVDPSASLNVPANDLVALGDGEHFVAAGAQGWIRAWRWRSGESVACVHGSEEPVRALFVLDQTQVLAVAAEKELRVWDVTRGETTRTLRGPAAPVAAATVDARDGRVVAVTTDGEALVWSRSASTPSVRWQTKRKSCSSIVSVSAANLVLTLSEGHLETWDADGGGLLHHEWAFEGKMDGPRAIVVLGPSHVVVTFGRQPDAFGAGGLGGAFVWEVDGCRRVAEWKTQGPVLCCATSRDGRRLAFGDRAGCGRVIEVAT